MTKAVRPPRPGSIALCYLALGVLWVIVSDWLMLELGWHSHDVGVETLKGVFFFGTSSLVVWAVARRLLSGETAARQELARSHERFARMIGAAPIGIVLSTLEEGRIVEVNQAALDALELRREDVVGRLDTELDLWSRPAERDAAMQRFSELKRLRSFPARWRTSRGEQREVELTMDRVEADGRPCVLTLFVDQTEVRQTAEVLRRREAHYRGLVETSPYAVFALDEQARFTELNRAGEEITGHDAAEVLGQPLSLLVAPEHLSRAREAFQRLLDGASEREELDLSVLRPTGERRLLSLAATPMRGEGQTGVHGIARDVTQERQQAEQLRRAERLASVGTLIGGVAHELNNPLTSIRGFAQLMLEDARDAEEREVLATVAREAERAARIVSDLRLLARGTQELRKDSEPVDLNDVVRHILRVREYALKTAGIEHRADLADEPPAVTGDRSDVEQAVLNLVVNAEQALSTVERQRRLLVRTRTMEGVVELCVADNGPGIAPEHLDLLFDPFWTTKAPNEGTGLGLSLVHNIVAEHGGRIEVSSQPGEGAEFTLTFPRAEHGPRGREGAVEEPPRAGDRQLRILVVDDEESVRRVLMRSLQRAGHDVVVAAEGAEALGRIEAAAEPFDLILSDLRMPGMGGVELMARLRQLQEPYDQRIAFLTGDVNAPETERLSERGIPLIGKPFDLQEVQALVRQLTDPAR